MLGQTCAIKLCLPTNDLAVLFNRISFDASMVLKSENARVPAKFFTKQKIAKSLEGRLLLIIKLCFKIVPINIDNHSLFYLQKHTVDESRATWWWTSTVS